MLFVGFDECLLVDGAGIDGLTVDTVEDEIVGGLFLGLVAADEHKDVLFGEAIVADAEVLAEVQRVLEAFDSGFGSGDLNLVTTRHDAHVGVLVFEAEDVVVIHSVKGRSIEGVLKCKYCFHVLSRTALRCRAAGRGRLVFDCS